MINAYLFYFLVMIPISEHVISSTSSGHAQVLPPFGVGKHKYLHPPFCLTQALVAGRDKLLLSIFTEWLCSVKLHSVLKRNKKYLKDILQRSKFFRS